ncbi:uncharacterized protein LOC143274738 [Babylonia areolata]|uniref:uncharacterized protein LOC143274738 n=1 Tax=Babylonia areolata TaxID=304850 RepID=UPI003FD1D1DB
MKVLFYFTVIAALVFIFGADARRGGRGRGKGPGGKRPPGPPRQPANVSRWERDVGGVAVSQKGVVVDSEERKTVVVMTFGPEARNASVTRGAVMYDFTNASDAVAAIRTGRRCFLITVPAGLDFANASEIVIDRDNSTVTDALTKVQLNGTQDPLTRDEVATTAPSVRRFCRGARIVQTEDADAATFPALGAEEEGQKVATVLTLNSEVKVLMATRSSPGGGNGKGRGGGKGRGKGGRGGNGRGSGGRGGNGRGSGGRGGNGRGGRGGRGGTRRG